MKVCFIGHKTIKKNEKLIRLLKETILTLIQKGVKIFIFGSKSEFDNLALEIVTEFKKTYPFIKRVYVRSAFQYIDKNYEKYLYTLYDETYFPQKIEKAGKYSYVERNYEMIDNSSHCVFYYDKNYIASLKRNSGTKIAYEYAIKKKKEIFNLYN